MHLPFLDKLPIPVIASIGPLQRRLGLMAAIALVPLAIMAVASVILSVHAQRENALRSAMNTVRAVSAAIDADHASIIATLETLALSPRLHAGDLRGFHAEIRELLSRRPGWTNVVLSNRAAQQVVNANIPFGRPLAGAVDPETLLKTLETSRASIGGMVLGRNTKEYTYPIRVPVHVRSEALVLTAVIKPERVLRLLDRTDVPAPGLMSVIDASHLVVARSRNQEQWVGKLATESLRQLMQSGESGHGSTRTLDGQNVVATFQRSPGSDWVVTMGLPSRYVDGPATRLYLLLGGGIIASLLLGLVGAYWVSLAITRPVRDLVEGAGAIGRGERPNVPPSALPEIRQVADALATAHADREKLLERERESRHQAEEANRLKDEFLAMLGHELRNPLSAISNASRILDHVTDTQSIAGREARDIIRRQAAQLGLLTDELTEVARVMSGNIPLERQPVDLALAVRHTVDTFRATGRLEEHELGIDLQPAWVSADPTRLEQIAANLLTNAVKYTPPGGRIGIAVRQEPGEDGTAQAVFEVTDNGVGLEPQLLPRVFDLFVQGKRSLDRSQGGLGIGLTLVKRLVEVFGGEVQAASDGAWSGSRFSVRLPAIAAPAAQAVTSPVSDTARPRRIVIVEDNEDARLSLRGLLELHGHEVHEATDGPAGIEAILAFKPDIALVDIGLPGADGYEVARSVRARMSDTPHHSLRLVAITGYGLPEDKQRSAEAGFDHHLVKPVDFAALQQVLSG